MTVDNGDVRLSRHDNDGVSHDARLSRHVDDVVSRHDDARLSCLDDDGVSRGVKRGLPAELVDCGDHHGAACDDVFCMHVDDDSQRQRYKHFFHVWAQYRIAQRGIMVSTAIGLLQYGLHLIMHRTNRLYLTPYPKPGPLAR